MAKMKIRYFVTKPGAGGRPKHFWQPALSLRADGWAPVRLSDNPTIAISEAENINQRLDAWRLGAPIAGAAGGDTDPEIFTTKAQTAVAAVTEGAPGGVSVSAGTIAAVVRSWRQSARYRALRPNSIITYERAIVQLLNTMGDLQVAALTPVLLARFYEIEHTRAPSDGKPQDEGVKSCPLIRHHTGLDPEQPGGRGSIERPEAEAKGLVRSCIDGSS